MNSFHGGETEAVLNAYSYEGIGVLADIGCGAGAVMMATLKRYPALRGMLFDQAHVLERTAANVRAAGFEGRCEMRAGSFFEAIPAGADAYSMRHILHDWDKRPRDFPEPDSWPDVRTQRDSATEVRLSVIAH